jgi:PAS domain S-box-containing protein
VRQDGLIVNGRRHVDRYRQIVELSSDSIKKLDSEGAIVFINAGGIAALEAPNQEAVLGKRWPHLWPAVFRVQAERAVASALAGNAYHFKGLCPSFSGQERWWSVTVHPLAQGSDTRERVLVISRDITDQITMERVMRVLEQSLAQQLVTAQRSGSEYQERAEELARSLNTAMLQLDRQQETRRQLERRLELTKAAADVAQRTAMQAEQAASVGRVIAGLAHDFNNMLQVAFLGLSTMSEHPGELSQRHLRAVDRSMGAVSRASILVKRLVALSWRAPVTEERCHLANLIDGLTDLIRLTMGHGMTLQIHHAPMLPPVLADGIGIEQAVINLCMNARDACAGNGTVAVRVERGEWRDKGKIGTPVCLSVEDNGCGMDSAVIEKIFEPYFTTKGDGHGTGLGLMQLRDLMTRCGGEVDVDSAIGRGSVFTLRFHPAEPMADQVVDISVPPNSSRQTPTAKPTETDSLIYQPQ